jgi:hypothetical protein
MQKDEFGSTTSFTKNLLTRMTRLIPKLLIVFVGQSVMAWFFYRSRVISHSVWTDSDLIVFDLPLALGFVVSAMVLYLSAFPALPPFKRALAVFVIAAGGAVISSFIGTVIGFNLYGT